MTIKPKNTQAKELSKWGIAIGVILVIGLSVIRGFWPLFGGGTSFGMSQGDILLLGLFCIGAWSPVYLSMWFDKFLGTTKVGACGNDS